MVEVKYLVGSLQQLSGLTRRIDPLGRQIVAYGLSAPRERPIKAPALYQRLFIAPVSLDPLIKVAEP